MGTTTHVSFRSIASTATRVGHILRLAFKSRSECLTLSREFRIVPSVWRRLAVGPARAFISVNFFAHQSHAFSKLSFGVKQTTDMKAADTMPAYTGLRLGGRYKKTRARGLVPRVSVSSPSGGYISAKGLCLHLRRAEIRVLNWYDVPGYLGSLG